MAMMFGAPAAPADIQLGPYKPKAFRTKGGRPACLVNASVTGCPDNTIIAFGGFDQFTDEVYNHVLRLDLSTFTWTLVDNYGEIPSVRMGHTTTYWRDNKLIVFGGENENRVYLADVYLFDITTSTWSQPQISGPVPRGRSRHSVCLHDDKLYVIGGTNGSDVLDDLVYLDLNTMTWSRAWKFVGRFDHASWVYKNRLYVFGGLTQEMDRTGELCWLDFSEHPTWKSSNGLTPQLSQTSFSGHDRHGRKERHPPNHHHLAAPSNSQNRYPSPMRQTSNPFAPGSVNAVRFIRGTDVPIETAGNHFHHFCNNTLLDFVTAANTIRDHETSLSALDLDSLVWKHLADGEDVFVNANYRWHYLAISHDSTTAYLIGCPLEEEGQESEYLSDILPIDLRRYGVTPERKEGELGGPGTMGFDLATMFDDASSADFIVTALNDNYCGDDEEALWAMVPHPRGSSPSSSISLATQGGAMTGITTVGHLNQQSPSSSANSLNSSTPIDPSISPAIHVHKLILLSRWPHFQRLYAAKMAEFHTGRLHIPEPYSVVKAFLYYLYTDSIAPSPFCSSLATVGGLLVISNIYNIPRLRALCLGRINKELDVDTAAGIWERAGVAGENLLRGKAARYCMMHWGRVVRSEGFRRLSKKAMLELFEEVDVEGRILGGEELEGVGGGGGGGYGFGGETGGEGDEGEGMEIS
ncbi:hypothetical protein TWF281_002078 [Arthrobotrys megalospora]